MSANIFQEDLKWSEAQHAADWWEPYYRRAFPGLSSIVRIPGPSAAQRAGIDKFVIIEGKRIAVQEKIRRDRAPTDIAIEFKHVPVNGNPPWDGWINKRGEFADYLAMGFSLYKTAFFFPFVTLRAAWKQNGEKWLQTYFIAKAPNPKINPNYHTHSICVPTKILMDCLIDAMEIKF